MALALEVWPEQREEPNSCEVKVPEEKEGYGAANTREVVCL